MTLAELIRSFRSLSRDRVEDYFWSDEEVKLWLNEAQAQACVRGRLIREDELQAVCQVALTAGKHSYQLHPTAYELIHLEILPANGDRPREVSLKSREWLDAEVRDWRRMDRPACMAIQDDITLRLVGTVQTGDVLSLECYRLPLQEIKHPGDKPEIHLMHHQHLVQWALHKAFSVPDAELFDPTRSDKAEQAFTAYFGPLPDSDARRTTRTDQVHHNVSILP